MFEFPDFVEEAEMVCALRFDAYKYSENENIELSEITQSIVKSLSLYEKENMNFAAFFALQRYLYKWGGERLTKSSEEHIAYDFLFLHLYQASPISRYRNEEYHERWERVFLPKSQEIAGIVRKSFCRV